MILVITTLIGLKLKQINALFKDEFLLLHWEKQID